MPAPRNKTMTLSESELKKYGACLQQLNTPDLFPDILDKTIYGDLFTVLPNLPASSFDLIFADPPYNLTKNFHGNVFRQTDLAQYEQWLKSWLPEMKRLLKPNGSIYVCGDWRSSSAIHRVLLEHFIVRNRISWEREKGRGAKSNWKNTSEDIWFATVSKEYTFNVDDVKLQRRVIAPYRKTDGTPKDWEQKGKDRYRSTYPSNLWTDLTVPFWSMAENTEHPTQKPEKLLAKIILASSNPGDVVFDPFLGSGTTSVVAKKLSRHYIGLDHNHHYACLAEKRLHLATENAQIQGYAEGQFRERNSG